MFFKKNNRGFGLIEIVIGAGIISVAIVALLGATKSFLRLARDTTYSVQANSLLSEGLEAVRMIRDDDYTSKIASLATSTSYYLYWSGTTWTSTTTPQVIDSFFTRKFTVESVLRNGNSDISASGSVDANTKKINVYVVYTSVAGTLATTSVSLHT